MTVPVPDGDRALVSTLSAAPYNTASVAAATTFPGRRRHGPFGRPQPALARRGRANGALHRRSVNVLMPPASRSRRRRPYPGGGRWWSAAVAVVASLVYRRQWATAEIGHQTRGVDVGL